jgi:DNA invertase Pin-like site-specific DNA recombinase
MNVIGYVRVSTNEQAEKGVSLAAQEQKIRGQCKLKGWQCVEVVRDDGYSAKDLKRPGLQRIRGVLRSPVRILARLGPLPRDCPSPVPSRSRP